MHSRAVPLPPCCCCHIPPRRACLPPSLPPSPPRPACLAYSHVARLVSFVAGSVAALLLCITFIDERLLERDLLGRQLVW